MSGFKVGDRFVVLKRGHHFFNVGEKVRLVGHAEWIDSRHKFKNESGIYQWLNDDEVKPASDFTKSDLKDGMRCTDREGDDWYVCGDFMACKPNGEDTDEEAIEPLDSWYDDLTDREVVCCDIIRVIDRDGAVLFERKPEKRKVMLELTNEQLEQIKKEYGL